jgi:hypothetical protein
MGIGVFFLLPGIAWFLTQRWWDIEKDPAAKVIDEKAELATIGSGAPDL